MKYYVFILFGVLALSLFAGGAIAHHNEDHDGGPGDDRERDDDEDDDGEDDDDNRDRQAPEVNILSPQQTTYNSNTYILRVSVSELAACTYSDGEVSGGFGTSRGDEVFETTVSGAAEGGHTLLVRCFDSSFNEGRQSVSFTIGLEDPIVVPTENNTNVTEPPEVEEPPVEEPPVNVTNSTTNPVNNTNTTIPPQNTTNPDVNGSVPDDSEPPSNTTDDDGTESETFSMSIASPTATAYTSSSYEVVIGLSRPGVCSYTLDGGVNNKSLTSTDNRTWRGNENSANGNYLLKASCISLEGQPRVSSQVNFSIAAAPVAQNDNSGGGGGGGGSRRSSVSRTATTPTQNATNSTSNSSSVINFMPLSNPSSNVSDVPEAEPENIPAAENTPSTNNGEKALSIGPVVAKIKTFAKAHYTLLVSVLFLVTMIGIAAMLDRK